MSKIGEQVRQLEKQRRDYMRKVMESYDDEYYAELRKLRDQCEHNFRFTHLGPVGHPWSYCTICGRSQVGELDT